MEKRLHRPGDDALQVACCPYYDDIFLTTLQGFVFSKVNALLGEASIIYSYGNSSMRPSFGNFSTRVHVERTYMTGKHRELNGCMILLDDFNEDNGATWVLVSSQNQSKRPDEIQFYSDAQKLMAPAGSVFFFVPLLSERIAF